MLRYKLPPAWDVCNPSCTTVKEQRAVLRSIRGKLRFRCFLTITLFPAFHFFSPPVWYIVPELSIAQRTFSKSLQGFSFECIGDSQTDDELIISSSLREFGRLIAAIEEERDRMVSSFITSISPWSYWISFEVWRWTFTYCVIFPMCFTEKCEPKRIKNCIIRLYIIFKLSHFRSYLSRS